MKVVLFRAWQPSHLTATFADLDRAGVGGTEFQLLLHAEALRDLGHDVVVVGVSRTRFEQDGVLFEASEGPAETELVLRTQHRDAALVLQNDPVSLRRCLPSAVLVQVCQNGPRLDMLDAFDLFAFVGAGQLAHHATRHASIRHRFVPLPNVVPWTRHYREVEKPPKRRQVIWVGGFTKPGLRRWGRAMRSVMRDNDLEWVLCGPSYAETDEAALPAALRGLRLPGDRVRVVNLPLRDLGPEIARSLVLLASLGGEDGPVSYLDGHALGVPVLCANDIVGYFATPAGTGFRCTTTRECRIALEYLLDHAAAREQLGSLGRRWVLEHCTEKHQRVALELLCETVSLHRSAISRSLLLHRARTDRKYPLRHRMEVAEGRIAASLARWITPGQRP